MTKRFMDSVRMTSEARRRLLDKMDEHARAGILDEQDDDRRAHRRHTYRPQVIAIHVEHPGGGYARYLVGARNLSQHGVGLIHGGFLYDNTTCIVVLESRQREFLSFPGRIVTCRHVDGTIHEVGVCFDHEIDIATYFKLVEPLELLPGADTVIRRDLRPLDGRLLFIDPSVAACDQARRYLADQPMTVQAVRHLGLGLDAIKRESFDVVVCAANLDGVDENGALLRIRQAGHCGPVAFVTRTPDQERDMRLHEMGVAEVALKPLSKARFFDLLVRCLNPDEVDTPTDHKDSVTSHLDSMQSRIDALESSIISEDLFSLRLACESIATASAQRDHHKLSLAADEALQKIRETGSTHAALEAIHRVAELAQAILGR